MRRQFGDEKRDAFATSLGISKDSLALYERGENSPSATVLAVYHMRFGVDANWLLTGEGEMYADPSKAPVSPDLHTIDPIVFKHVGKLIANLHEEHGIKLPPDAFLDEHASAYNTLIEQAEDPRDRNELVSLLIWLETRLRKKLKAAKAEPGSGKQQA